MDLKNICKFWSLMTCWCVISLRWCRIMAVHKCCTFRSKQKNLLSPTPVACCPLLALRSIQLMTSEPWPRYSVLQLLGESGACGLNWARNWARNVQTISDPGETFLAQNERPTKWLAEEFYPSPQLFFPSNEMNSEISVYVSPTLWSNACCGITD